MMSPSTSAIDTFILLFCLLSSFSHISCHDTVTGNNRQGRKCESGKYLLQKPGGLKCQRCTLMCDGQKNQMEVTSCSQERNRVCFCKPGFYCSEGNKYNTYCHNACIPCATGTFSSKPSLTSSCTPHTDCEKLGMKVLKEGSTTQDRECVSDTKTAPATTKHSTTSFSNDIITNPSNTITSSSPSAPKSSNAITNSSSSAIISSNTSTTRSSKDNRANSSSSSANFSSTTITSSFSTDIISSNAIAVSSKAGSTASPVHMPKENQTQWFMLFIILMLILCMTGFCVLLKGKTKKTLSKCFGFINGKHDDKHGCGQTDFQAYALMDCTGEDEMPLGGDVREVKGQRLRTAPPSGGVQQVTMEHKGKGENVSNTVGSIYIYSPGMVILGSGSGDKKEDAGVCEEAVPFMSTPQQESNPPLQELRIQMSTQEQANEELSLSFPVPATGK